MINIEIDGQHLDVPEGAMIIEAADNAGIRIPRFCYHKKLSIAANCRMCLVEVGNAPKPLPACATPVSDGMVVKTRSPKALEAQKSVMAFLLINHPLDCPICDQGGECELQDVAMGYGADVSRFTEGKRVVKDKDLGPLIATDMTRCIHCTRCVRFGSEVAGIRELGATGRGEHTEIGTFIEQSVESELSGNVIDVCPVGALTSKPFRFKARAWELKQYPSIAAHDCLGSNTFVHRHHDSVMRVVPREAEAVNEVWLSDRDRFSYQGLQSIDRLTTPRIKQSGQWVEASWADALQAVAEGLKSTAAAHGPAAIGTLISPNATTEECFLAQQLMRAMGSDNIDHRLDILDFVGQASAPLYPEMGTDIESLSEKDVVLLVGSDIQREQPLLSARLYQATQHQTKVLAINPVDFEFSFEVDVSVTPPAGQIHIALAGVLKECLLHQRIHDDIPSAVTHLLENVVPTDAQKALAQAILQGRAPTILLGQLALGHPEASAIRYLAQFLAHQLGATFGVLTKGANSAGAWLAGAVPHRGPFGVACQQPGLNAREMSESGLRAYLLCNLDPECDTVYGHALIDSLSAADFVVATTPYVSPALLAQADVLLPMAPAAETPGTFVNANGRKQAFIATGLPMGEARPLWKILRVMGNVLKLEGFEYQSIEEVRDALERQQNTQDWVRGANLNCPTRLSVQEADNGLVHIAPHAIYNVDNVTRRATALQATKAAQQIARMNPQVAERLGLSQAPTVSLRSAKGHTFSVPLAVDTRVPEGVIWLPLGFMNAAQSSQPYQPLEVVAV